MSTTAEPKNGPLSGMPELTALGRQLEMLRLDRGLSKQALARDAGTSRQQLWRVMTGKSELTTSLCQRLAEVLGIDARVLRDPDAFARAVGNIATSAAEEAGHAVGALAAGAERIARKAHAPTVAEYLADP